MTLTKSIVGKKFKDKRWTKSDKLMDYRAILKLHEREKKIQEINATLLKKKVARDLHGLKKDVKSYREIINDISLGNKRSLHLTLLQHKDIKLALRDLNPAEVYEVLYQDNHTKEKQLNKMLYEKKKKMKHLFELKLELSTMTEKLREDQEFQPDLRQQYLVKFYQRTVSKYKAVKSIQSSYKTMIDALKKDSVHYDLVFNGLKIDQIDQCRLILRSTMIGQSSVDNLEEITLRYKQTVREVIINMKERERTLEIAREQVKDLWAYAQSVVRVESDTDFTKKGKVHITIDESLEQELNNLENIFEKIKVSLLVRSYEELFARLESQIRRKRLLDIHFNHYKEKRNALLNKINHADKILALQNHAVTANNKKFAETEAEIIKELDNQRKKEDDLKQRIKSRGELLMMIKAALQNMLSILVCIKYGTEQKRKLPKKEEMESSKIPDKQDILTVNLDKERIKSDDLNKIETDGLQLLSEVSRKIGILFAMSNFQLDREKEDKAKDLYQNYISNYRSKLAFDTEAKEDSSIFIEHDIIDEGIMTRADIKNKSKKIVDDAKLN